MIRDFHFWTTDLLAHDDDSRRTRALNSTISLHDPDWTILAPLVTSGRVRVRGWDFLMPDPSSGLGDFTPPPRCLLATLGDHSPPGHPPFEDVVLAFTVSTPPGQALIIELWPDTCLIHESFSWLDFVKKSDGVIFVTPSLFDDTALASMVPHRTPEYLQRNYFPD